MYSPATLVAGTTATVTSGFSTALLPAVEAAELPHAAAKMLTARSIPTGLSRRIDRLAGAPGGSARTAGILMPPLCGLRGGSGSPVYLAVCRAFALFAGQVPK